MAIPAPNRAATEQERKHLTKKAALAQQRTDCPDRLAVRDIRQAPNLFQPRFDSIAYAPGRSDGHITGLAQVARAGNELDPITIAAFGAEWFLIDGHHRLAAYAEAGWTKPVPVRALHSDLRGEDRVEWAIQQSYADNKKNRLNLVPADKADGAWAAVARGVKLSIAGTAEMYDVSERTVATMRKVKRELEAFDAHMPSLTSWRRAKGELRSLQDHDAPSTDLSERRRRILAKRLAPAMGLQVTPGQLAEALEAFEPGIVDAMALAIKDLDDDLDDDLDG